jgi:hypothetical protein
MWLFSLDVIVVCKNYLNSILALRSWGSKDNLNNRKDLIISLLIKYSSIQDWPYNFV